MKHKGFQKPKPNKSGKIPVSSVEKISTTNDRLEKLLGEVVEKQLPRAVYEYLKRLACMPPAVRLAVNLKDTISLMSDQDVTNPLVDGLPSDVREVLIAVDSASISLESRRTAHSLFNVEARVKVIETMSGYFRDTRTRKGHMLSRKPLD